MKLISTEELADMLKGCRMRVGLRQQGHMGTVTQMIVAQKSWEEIGEAIGWHGPTAKEWYERESAREIIDLRAQVKRIESLLNTPETEDFDKAVPLEAAHQVNRWGAEHDAGKNPEDWFWLVGYLAGKALAAHRAGDQEKAKQHCISTAAVLRNWHAHIRSGASVMRPGISAEKAAVAE